MSVAAKKTADKHVSHREMVIQNKQGMHARPASMFVRTASKFQADIFVERSGERVNGKSIMGLMMLAAGPGSHINVIAEGEDGPAALDEIESLLKRKFGED